jgi:AcrR family transcriptional regulator
MGEIALDRTDRDPSKKERLAKAGRELFAQRGFHATSVRDIANRAGVNVSLVSYYFGGKEQLYAHIVEDLAARIRTVFSPERIDGLSPEEKIRHYAGNIMALHREYPQLARIIHHEMNAPTPVLNTLQESLFPVIFGFLRNACEEGIDDGTFRPGLDPTTMSYSLASLVNFYHLQKSLIHRINPAFADRGSHIVDQALDIFFYGVKALPGEQNDRED